MSWQRHSKYRGVEQIMGRGGACAPEDCGSHAAPAPDPAPDPARAPTRAPTPAPTPTAAPTPDLAPTAPTGESCAIKGKCLLDSKCVDTTCELRQVNDKTKCKELKPADYVDCDDAKNPSIVWKNTRCVATCGSSGSFGTVAKLILFIVFVILALLVVVSVLKSRPVPKTPLE